MQYEQYEQYEHEREYTRPHDREYTLLREFRPPAFDPSRMRGLCIPQSTTCHRETACVRIRLGAITLFGDSYCALYGYSPVHAMPCMLRSPEQLIEEEKE